MSSSAPEFAIYVCKPSVLFLVAMPTELVAMVTSVVLDHKLKSDKHISKYCPDIASFITPYF